MEKVLFKEEQRFSQWWLWLVLIGAFLTVLIPFGCGIYSQEVLNKPFGDTPMSTEGLIVVGVFSNLMMAFIFYLLIKSKLKTKITSAGIWVSYPPIINKWKKFTPSEIEKYEVRTYRANWEFGGHGMKRRKKFGQSYTVSGNIGLQLYFKNGKKLLIGTQKKQAIEHAMGKIMGTGRILLPEEKRNKKNVSPVWKKTKKILIILAVEVVLAILIFGLIQIFK